MEADDENIDTTEGEDAGRGLSPIGKHGLPVRVKRRKVLERRVRRQKVADLILRGVSSAMEISRQLNVSRLTVASDIKWLEERWAHEHVEFTHKHKIKLLRELEEVIKEAYLAWDKSKENMMRVVEKNGKDGTETTTTVEGRYGDSNLLRVIKDAIDKKADLLGLKVKKISPTSPDGETAYHSQVMHDVMQVVEQARQGSVVIDSMAVDRALDEATAKRIAHDKTARISMEESLRRARDKQRAQHEDGDADPGDGGDTGGPADVL